MALEQCAPHRANAWERYWVRKLTPNLNIRDTPKYSRKWILLFRGGIREPDNDRRSIEQKIAHIQHTLRTHATLPERLSLLHGTARNNVTSDTCNYLYQKVSHNIRQATGLMLPQHLPMGLPQLRSIASGTLRDQVGRHISTLPIPPALREYYSKTISVVGVCHQSLQDSLCTCRIRMSFQEMQTHASMPCKYATHLQHTALPTIDGHIVVRRPVHLRTLFGTQAPILLHDMQREVVAP